MSGKVRPQSSQLAGPLWTDPGIKSGISAHELISFFFFFFFKRRRGMGSVMTNDWVHGFGHSPVSQILLQIVVRALITSTPPAWTSSAGMLLTPADITFCNDCTATSTSLRRIGWSSSVSVLMDLHWPCCCTAQSSILSIGSVSVALL